MNAKIDKLRSDLAKNKEKIAELQSKNRELERQIVELENSEILALVRGSHMTIPQLTALIKGMKTDPAATLRGISKKEEEPHA